MICSELNKDFACGNFTNTLANSSVNRSEFQCLNFTIPIKNKSEITNTSCSSITSINQTCCESSNKYGHVESSKIFLLLSKNLAFYVIMAFNNSIPLMLGEGLETLTNSVSLCRIIIPLLAYYDEISPECEGLLTLKGLQL